MRFAILFCVLLGVFIGLLLAFVFRRRPGELGWRCRNAKCGAFVDRPTGTFCPACGASRFPLASTEVVSRG